jgi:hypothetical protein|nr:MAG TPA: hypothetical protein [Bacteriophage sp.]
MKGGDIVLKCVLDVIIVVILLLAIWQDWHDDNK